ncbi:MAG TPA: extracellular solute-binding protein [Opitutaceae bacterium]|nr:extracellular solute-binding protein [Opitutaceae bacterium]HND61086.1 extracellular solute-binding protein [Opitutaceae bacterium]
MRRTLLFSLLALTALSAALYWTKPENRSTVTVLYWMTQNDAVKRETVALFRQWLVDQGLPPVEVRIDHSNQDITKKLVQGVSGVGGDLIDLYYSELETMQATGMLTDLTDIARREGYGTDTTYPAAYSDITVRGRQYGYPRNVDVTMIWVNRDTFARYNQPEPPRRWSWDEFEERGRRFVAAANPPGTRQRVYYINRVWPYVLRRGLGLSTYNETMTRCTLDDPRNVEVLRRLYRWTVEERLMPTSADQAAMAADGTAFDSSFGLFASGRFAMIYEGLWALIRLRPLGDFRLGAVEPFTGGFTNTEVGSGAVAVYAGTKHPVEARRFLQFLTSEPFNLLIARSGDSLPPRPQYAAHPEFLRPPGYEQDWAAKAEFARACPTVAIAQSKSPFALPSVVHKIDVAATEGVVAGQRTPEEAAREEAQRINAEIALTISQDADLRKLYDERVALQREIDARRAAGRKVPVAWISDPFHVAYYRAQGWLEEETR